MSRLGLCALSLFSVALSSYSPVFFFFSILEDRSRSLQFYISQDHPLSLVISLFPSYIDHEQPLFSPPLHTPLFPLLSRCSFLFSVDMPPPPLCRLFPPLERGKSSPPPSDHDFFPFFIPRSPLPAPLAPFFF